jgi:hypothetical protein
LLICKKLPFATTSPQLFSFLRNQQRQKMLTPDC